MNFGGVYRVRVLFLTFGLKAAMQSKRRTTLKRQTKCCLILTTSDIYYHA